MNFYRIKAWYYTQKLKLAAWSATSRYKFWHWLFRWNLDEEGDIVFSVANLVHFTKYKEHTVINFGRRSYNAAPKYVFDK